MLQAIWDVLDNYGLEVTEIAEAMKTLIWFNPDTNEYEGNLAKLVDFPVIGDILKAFASAIPNVQLD